MDLKLYQHLKKKAFAQPMDFSQAENQRKLENWDKSLGFDDGILGKIRGDLKDYNRYLHTQGKEAVQLRYYQILALYFTELYFKEKGGHEWLFSTDNAAYWMATGSGKTLIMHLNVLQYLRHQKNWKSLELVVTTPGVNLIGQHERELTPFVAWLNNENQHRITMTIDTTSALLQKPDDFFSSPAGKTWRRLILVDEAHIGLGSGASSSEGEFLRLRKRLNIEGSFLFEYSATFHNMGKALEREYERSIVFDYNYNLFYQDGYGKDFYFQQIGDDVLEGSFDDNLHHNLHIATEKLRVWKNMDYRVVKDLFDARQFPDRPLIAFMGNTVNSKGDKHDDDEISDIAEIIRFLANLNDREKEKYALLFNGDYAGALTLTRNLVADDEILLSYGNGDYWGIVNVGNGAKFINDLPFENVVRRTSEHLIVSDLDRYLFQNLDSRNSPVNVLIGSRKFAEGWNCFRVSVIGLINLGSSKGNKIIQIFGRGVRLHGLARDGKRKFQKHVSDYFSLFPYEHSEERQVRILETLCVFSLKKSYLQTFTKAVNEELLEPVTLEIEVSPSVIALNGGAKLTFEEYRERLPVFKLARTEVTRKKVFLTEQDGVAALELEYWQDGEHKQAALTKTAFALDYRVDTRNEGTEISGILKNGYPTVKPYLRGAHFRMLLRDLCDESGITLFVKKDGQAEEVDFSDLLNYASEIKYKGPIDIFDIDLMENTVQRIAEDIFKKVRNRVNWQINNSNYVFGESLQQDKNGEKGDFIEKYYIVRAFAKEGAMAEIERFKQSTNKIREQLSLSRIGRHIYQPLLREANERVGGDLEKDLKISPDKLNVGERQFVADCAEYFQQNGERFRDFEIYLMRNVESLKSIGIYLDADEAVFYPDFLLWMVGKEVTYLMFIDPKGQTGMVDAHHLSANEKVRIADKSSNDTLPSLERELSAKTGRKVVLNSFLLLPHTSKWGKDFLTRSTFDDMMAKHVLRLDWSDMNGKPLPPALNGKTYLDWMMEKIMGD